MNSEGVAPVNVLVVNKSTALRRVLFRLLQGAELPFSEIYEAADAQEAFTILEQKTVDLILSDTDVPPTKGWGFLAKLRATESLKSIPLVITTRDASEESVLQAVKLDALAYILIPFTSDRLREKLLGWRAKAGLPDRELNDSRE